MKQQLTRSLAAILTSCALLGSGCAGSYTAIRPDRIATYQSSAATAPVQFGYQFDALRMHGRNKKYTKKEQKKGYHVVAVRVTNTTGADINFSRDAVLYYGDRPVSPVAASIAAQDMKQGVFIYLLYVLLNFTVGGTTTTTSSGYGTTTTSTSGGTYLPTGPFIAGGNMLGASLANTNFRNELEQYDLTDRIIHPGETVFGLISVRETSVAPMRLELRSLASNSAPAIPTPMLTPATTPAPGISN